MFPSNDPLAFLKIVIFYVYKLTKGKQYRCDYAKFIT